MESVTIQKKLYLTADLLSPASVKQNLSTHQARADGGHKPLPWLNTCNIAYECSDKNSIRDSRTPQPREIFFNTMRYTSTVSVQGSGYFQSTVSYKKVQTMFT